MLCNEGRKTFIDVGDGKPGFPFQLLLVASSLSPAVNESPMNSIFRVGFGGGGRSVAPLSRMMPENCIWLFKRDVSPGEHERMTCVLKAVRKNVVRISPVRSMKDAMKFAVDIDVEIVGAIG